MEIPVGPVAVQHLKYDRSHIHPPGVEVPQAGGVLVLHHVSQQPLLIHS